MWLLLACAPQIPDRAANATVQDWPSRPEVDEAVLAEMKRSDIAGLAACTIDDGAVEWCGAYGWADLEGPRAVDETTPFLQASVSKAIVGVAAQLAVEDGLLLDEAVKVGFEVAHPSSSVPLTPRMLAGHVAGIFDDWDELEKHYVSGDSDMPLDGFLQGYLTPGGLYYSEANWGTPPMGWYEYSNVGAALLALTVQESAGQDFADFCTERIFSPLGMGNTAWHLADLTGDPAMPYTGRQLEPTGHFGFPDYPDGQLRASALDMARFVVAYGDMEELRDIRWPMLEEDQGFAWYRWFLDAETVWGHNGGEMGTSAEIGVLADGRGFAVMMNGEGRGTTLERVERAILGL